MSCLTSNVPKTGPAKIFFDESPSSMLGVIAENIFAFVMVHYFLWNLVAFLVGIVMYLYGYGYIALGLVAIYLPSYLDNSQNKGGRPWTWLRKHPIWELGARCFSLRMVREAELDPKKKYVFGFHPHGILILSRVAGYGGFWEALFPGVDWRVLGASPMFFVPGAREICLWMNAVDAGRPSAEGVLRSGQSVLVYPGGSKEIFHTDPDSTDTVLVLKKRLGFVKLAMREGADLVPTYVFGEKWMYNKWTPPEWLRHLLLDKLKIPLIVFWGRFCTWLPLKRAPLAVVFGKPIEVTKIANPTNEQVKELHKRYCTALVALFEKHKLEHGYSEKERVVLE